MPPFYVDNPGYNSQEFMAVFALVTCFRWACHEQGISTSVSWLPSLVHAPFTPAVAWPRIPCQQPSPSQNALLASSFTSWAVQHLHQNTSWLHGIAKVGADPRIRTAACHQPQPQGWGGGATLGGTTGRMRHNHIIPGHHTPSTELWQTHAPPPTKSTSISSYRATPSIPNLLIF